MATISRNFIIPGQRDLGPVGPVVFEKVVIGAASPSGQAPAMGPPFYDLSFIPYRSSDIEFTFQFADPMIRM
jgi:hypothetical protein